MENKRQVQIFPSKKDLGLSLVIWVFQGFGLVMSFLAPTSLIKVIMIMATLLLLWGWLGTYYTVTGKELIIRSGPFRQVIPISQIKSIRKSKNPLASPALSLQRLEIRHQKGIILISPKNEDSFLECLKNRFPE